MNAPALRRFVFFASLWFSGLCSAHERWILTPEQIAYWNELPKPLFYTELSFGNVAMVAMFLLFIFGWIRLGFTGARELFPDLQARLASYGEHVPRILRVCLAWLLISSAFGVEPRTGVEPFSSPTLLAPDLELNALNAEWGWLRWLEVLLGLAILFGIYVRFCAVLLMLLGLLAGWLFGLGFLAYGGALLGSSIYLLLQGPGRHYPPLPTPEFLVGIENWLAAQPRPRAQAIMRVLTGVTMLYLGIHFKIMQPNLTLAILKIYQVPILSAAPEGFSLFMALVEVSAGLLMIAGILLRPLSLFLLFAFVGFATLLPETLTEHILFYGVLLSCLINSAGYWRLPVARDREANILVVGGGFAALHAAMKAERLIGAYTNVKVTLLHENSNFLFTPLLPEVIGGSVQAGNAVNPIRRIVRQTNVVVGRLEAIDEEAKLAIARRTGGERIKLPYTELILAQAPKPKLSSIAGLLSHALPIDSAGDAMHIRKRLLDLVEEAEFNENPAERTRLLSFAVIGSGELACGTAAEISQMLRAAESSYPVLRSAGWQVHLYEDPEYSHSDFEWQIMAMRNECLRKAGVTLHPEDRIVALTADEIQLADGSAHPVGMTVNAAFNFPPVRFIGADGLAWPFAVKDDLALETHEHIWIAGPRKDGEHQQFVGPADWRELGEIAGYNAWASSQGFKTLPFRQPARWVKAYGIGFHSLCDIGAFAFSGRIAWFISRLLNLLVLPGLEKNVRIMIDWALVIPFRGDITVLAPAPVSRLQRVTFEKGDEVFHQGEEAEMAYVVESGRLEMLKDDRKVGELGPGDYFGEIALSYLNRRAETVRCISDCELTVLSQNDFKALTKGAGLMGKAIQHLASDRPRASQAPSESGLKRLIYVSTMHVPFTDEEIVELGRRSSLNNRKLGLTGVLISVQEYFFQILEGKEEALDALLEKIRCDSRHRDLTVLGVERGLEERMFSDWGMRTVCLNDESGVLMQAIRMMLRNIAQSHHIIGRYTQPAVLMLLTEGINPLTVPARQSDKIVLFGGVRGFAELSGRHSAEKMVDIVNAYLEIASACVVEHGGQVARYNGDGIVAHFPPDQADAAISACQDALRGLAELRETGNPTFRDLYGAFGLAAGPAIEGNVGSSVKMDYTILGTAANEAARLAEMSQTSETFLTIGAAVKQAARAAWNFRALPAEGETAVYTVE